MIFNLHKTNCLLTQGVEQEWLGEVAELCGRFLFFPNWVRFLDGGGRGFRDHLTTNQPRDSGEVVVINVLCKHNPTNRRPSYKCMLIGLLRGGTRSSSPCLPLTALVANGQCTRLATGEPQGGLRNRRNMLYERIRGVHRSHTFGTRRVYIQVARRNGAETSETYANRAPHIASRGCQPRAKGAQ